MNLLASLLYDPAAAVTKATTAGTAMAAFDTTNCRLTGTVPPSGKLYWKIKTAVHGATTLPQILLGVMAGAAISARMAAMFGGGNVAATTITAVWAEGTINGLTPGAAFTLDAAWACETGVASTGIKYGGPNDTTVNNAFGGLAFEIYDPCPIYTPASGAAPTTTVSQRIDTIDDFVDTEIGALTTAVAGVQADTDNIQTRLPAALVSGRMDCSVGAMAADVITAAATASDFGTEVGTAVWATGTRVLTAGTNIALAKGTGVTGFNDLSAAQVNAEVDTALADVGLTTTVTGRIDAAISSRSTYAGADTSGTTTLLSRLTSGRATALDNLDATVSSRASATDLATVAGYIDTEIGSIKGVVDKLDTAMELDGAVYRFTTNALEQAPVGGGGGGLDAAGVRSAIGLATANLDTQLATLATAANLATVDTVVDAIKAQTDQVQFAGANVKVSLEALRGNPFTGSGSGPYGT